MGVNALMKSHGTFLLCAVTSKNLFFEINLMNTEI